VNGKDSTSYYTLLFAARQSDGNSGDGPVRMNPRSLTGFSLFTDEHSSSINSNVTPKTCLYLLLILTTTFLPWNSYAQSPNTALGITVLQGKNGIVDETHMLEIVVRVTRPGAIVKFQLMPGSGVSLPGGATQATIRSDANGMASSGLLSSGGKGGDFEIEVVATLDQQTAMTTVHARNGTGGSVGTGKQATHKSHTLLWVAILGGAGAGVALAAMSKSGSSSDSSAPPVPVTFGNPTVGAPQ
jgi:hypothetical protein